MKLLIFAVACPCLFVLSADIVNGAVADYGFGNYLYISLVSVGFVGLISFALAGRREGLVAFTLDFAIPLASFAIMAGAVWMLWVRA